MTHDCQPFVSRLLERFGERSDDSAFAVQADKCVACFALRNFLGAYFAIQAVFDLNNESFSFSFGGILLFGLSFSLKDLVAPLMSGILLLFDKPFRLAIEYHSMESMVR